jgi:N-acetylmuramoyl-L-alanine amidase
MVGVGETTGQRERSASRSTVLFVVAAVCFASACDALGWGAAPSTSAAPVALVEPCPESLDSRTSPLPAVARCEDDLAARAERLEGTPDAVVAARRAAELARARAVREQDEVALDRARSYLVEAARRRATEGACEAELALAELEARDRVDLQAAYGEAHRIVRRFDDGAHAECVARARQMLGTLEAFRPGPGVLAAIEADPDADDPSIGLATETTESAMPATASAFAAWAAAQPASSSVSLDLVSIYGGAEEPRGAVAGSVRVVLGLSELVRFEASELPADGELPGRFVILLPATALGRGVAETTSVGAGGLTRVRLRAEGPGARVTLDLERDARATLFVLPEPFRVIIDVRAAGEQHAAVTGPQALELLVLDPGHGGDDFGARAFGLEEQDITLDLAMRVREILRARLRGTRVVLTREEDRFVSLEQRTAMANAVGADAFVSIHLNAAWEDVQHGGVTTFVLDTNDDRQAVRLAARENGTSEHEVGALSRILAGLHRDEQSTGSRALAAHIHRSTLAGGRRVLPRLYDRGVRSAMFYVLVGATMPAVLVEASFMTRRDEADALRTEGYRQSLAEGIADGIVAYARGDAAPEEAR